jgi:alpha-L-fucosidase
VNGEAIYGTTGTPFANSLPWGRCTKKLTAKGGTLYLHVFDWPADGKLVVPSLDGKVRSARLLATGEKLAINPDDNGQLVISVPKNAPDKISSTIKLEVQGPIQST